MLAFLTLQLPGGKELAVNVEDIVGIIGQGSDKGAQILLSGGHEVEVVHSMTYILVNLQRQLVGKEQLSDREGPLMEEV